MKALIISLALFVSGCAGFSFGDDASTKLVVQYAVLKYDEQSPGNLGRVVEVAEDIKAKLTSDQDYTLALLSRAVYEKIDAAQLSPADTMLARALTDIIAGELNKKLGDGVLKPEQVARVADVLEWVIGAAAFVPTKPE